MNNILTIVKRGISTSASLNGKKNFRKFLLYNHAGTKKFQEARKAGAYPDIPVDLRGLRETGYWRNGKFVHVPEMVPQLIVPNLEGFELKAYVSYRSPDVTQTEFTAEDLFYEVYAPKMVDDWNNKKLDENGQPNEPSKEELMDADDAILAARKTGSDIFQTEKQSGLANLAKF